MNEISDTRPNLAEKEFLTLAYNRFYDLFEEIIQDKYREANAQYRFSKIKDIFTIYSELLNYEPIKWSIEQIKTNRPPMEAEISSELFKFIRNIIVHFPFFDTWESIFFNKTLVNWNKEGQSINKFLMSYENKGQIKYRFWEADKKRMTYLSINFPNNYSSGERIYLKDILIEKDGIKFSAILMKKIFDIQVEKITA